MPSRNSLLRVALIAATLIASWLGMQAVHEMGHVLGARFTGGEVAQVVLHPLTLSRTDLARNPHPLPVVWLGPIVGVTAPLLLWCIAYLVRLPGAFLLRFFAGFCLIANGVYLGIGSLAGVGTVATFSTTARRSGSSGCSVRRPCRWDCGSGIDRGDTLAWEPTQSPSRRHWSA